ncbi:MAG: hypothetical protein ACOCP8_07895 [archaeon]
MHCIWKIDFYKNDNYTESNYVMSLNKKGLINFIPKKDMLIEIDNRIGSFNIQKIKYNIKKGYLYIILTKNLSTIENMDKEKYFNILKENDFIRYSID